MPAIMRVSNYERKWLDHYEQLKKYMETHGDCNVPTKHEHLGSWVRNQRQRYRLLKEGKSSSMTDDRKRKLESIGFQWVSDLGMTNKGTWHERFQELKEFKAKHGDCDVPTKHESLGRWVGRQRQTYQLLKEGKSSPMTDDRIRKLESIGFQWISERTKKGVSRRVLINKGRRVLWHERFQELKEFKAKHGNCNVTTRRESLGRWVGRQRQNYRFLKEGKSSPMTDDCIRKLESIGFQWISERAHKWNMVSGSALTNKERHDMMWHERFQELKEFKAKHADCNVPTRHKSLNTWINRQRRHYRFLEEGKSSPMTDDRLRKLESIGFLWVRERALINKEQHDMWHERFQELKEFKAKHGNCNALTRREPLGKWVRNQRRNYRLLKEGKSPPMTDDRIRKLESIGFQWIR